MITSGIPRAIKDWFIQVFEAVTFLMRHTGVICVKIIRRAADIENQQESLDLDNLGTIQTINALTQQDADDDMLKKCVCHHETISKIVRACLNVVGEPSFVALRV